MIQLSLWRVQFLPRTLSLALSLALLRALSLPLANTNTHANTHTHTHTHTHRRRRTCTTTERQLWDSRQKNHSCLCSRKPLDDRLGGAWNHHLSTTCLFCIFETDGAWFIRCNVAASLTRLPESNFCIFGLASFLHSPMFVWRARCLFRSHARAHLPLSLSHTHTHARTQTHKHTHTNTHTHKHTHTQTHTTGA